jgi:hypothetical protein
LSARKTKNIGLGIFKLIAYKQIKKGDMSMKNEQGFDTDAGLVKKFLDKCAVKITQGIRL